LGPERRRRRLMHPAASQALFEEEAKHLSPALCERRKWVMHHLAFPLINLAFMLQGRTPLRLSFKCDNWNDLPPSIRLENLDGTPLTKLLPNPTGVFHTGPHHLTNLPFVCMRGSREYHTHPSHVTDLWDSIRGQSRYTLGGIMTQVWNAWLKGSG
jgi:hypothetical protein